MRHQIPLQARGQSKQNWVKSQSFLESNGLILLRVKSAILGQNRGVFEEREEKV